MFVLCAVQKDRAEKWMHDSVLKNNNKTLLEILLVGLNIYLTMGEHSIAYTDTLMCVCQVKLNVKGKRRWSYSVHSNGLFVSQTVSDSFVF